MAEVIALIIMYLAGIVTGALYLWLWQRYR